jgi:hypothetical protein
MAILAALFATVLLMGLGVSIVLLGTTEATLAAHDRTARSLREASFAVMHLAVADLRAQPAWSAVLAEGIAPGSAAPGRAGAGSPTPPAPWGGPPLDLRQITAEVAAAADTGIGDAQVWRLYEHASLPHLTGDAAGSPFYVAAWVADDRADGDGDPAIDRNGILAVRALAFGPGNTRAVTAVSIRKTSGSGGPDVVRILTVQPRP